MAYKNQKKNKAHSNALRKANRPAKIEKRKDRRIRELVNSGVSERFAKLIAR